MLSVVICSQQAYDSETKKWGVWTAATFTLDNSGKVTSEQLGYFHVFYDEKYYCFFIDENKCLYRINYLEERPSAAKFGSGKWTFYNIDRLLLDVDYAALHTAKQHREQQQRESRVDNYCRTLLHDLAERGADAVQTRRLIGNTLEAEASELSTQFYSQILEKYRQKIYTDLTEILRKTAVKSESLIMNIITYWANAWEKLYPMCFAYPHHPVTQVMIKLVEKLSEELNKSAVELFMPSVSNFETSYRPELFHPDLRTLTVTELLSTHLPSHSLRQLLPIALCLNPKADSDILHIFSPYYYDNRDNPYITAEDWWRLWHHSPLTSALCDAQERFDKISRDESTLLGQLNLLCTKFGAYGSHEGIGTAEKAADGIYPVLISFFTYYDSLGLERKSQVPSDINARLETIRAQLFAGEGRSLLHRAGVVTCISSHRTQLETLMNGKESILDGIQPSIDTREIQVGQALAELQQRRDDLKKALDNPKTYSIHSKIPFTPALLNELTISLRIRTFEDLEMFRAFSADEITILLNHDQKLKADVLTQFDLGKAFDNFAVFLYTYPPVQITAILRALHNELIFKFHIYFKKIFTLIKNLDPERINAFLTAVPDFIMINPISATTGTFMVLMPDDLAAMVEFIPHSNFSKAAFFLRSVISAPAVNKQGKQEIFSTLSADELKIASTLLRCQLGSRLSFSDFPVVLESLSPEKFSVVLDIFPDYVNLGLINHLSVENANLLLRLRPKLLSTINTIEKFDNFLCNINIIKYQFILPLLFSTFKGENNLLFFMQGCISSLKNSSDAKHEFFLEFIVNILFDSDVKTSEKILCLLSQQHQVTLLSRLPPEKIITLYQSINWEVVNLPSLQDLLALKIEDQELIYNSVKPTLIHLLQTANNFTLFTKIFFNLRPKDRAEQQKKILDLRNADVSLIDIVAKNPKDLLNLLKLLSQENIDFIALEPLLLKSLNTIEKVAKVLEKTKDDARTYLIVYTYLKQYLSKYTLTADTFESIFKHLTKEHRLEMFAAKKDILVALLNSTKSIHDFWFVIRFLPQPQFLEIWNETKTNFNRHLETIPALKYFLLGLPSEQYKYILENIQLDELRSPLSEIVEFLEFITPNDLREQSFQKNFNTLSHRIQSLNDFLLILPYLSLEQSVEEFKRWLHPDPKVSVGLKKCFFIRRALQEYECGDKQKIHALIHAIDLIAFSIPPSTETKVPKNANYFRHTLSSNQDDQLLKNHNITDIKVVVTEAVNRYIAWSRNKDVLSYSRGKYGLFTRCRHTEKGVANAEKFRENLISCDSKEALAECLTEFRHSYTIFERQRYNTHSCVSFVLDALSL